jgi:hypothetical protein
MQELAYRDRYVDMYGAAQNQSDTAFERDLQSLMNVRGIRTKSDAIRIAVQETARRGAVADTAEFGELSGAGLRASMNAKPKFSSEDELWS